MLSLFLGRSVAVAYIEIAIAGDDEFLMVFTPTNKKKRRTSLEKGGLGTNELRAACTHCTGL